MYNFYCSTLIIDWMESDRLELSHSIEEELIISETSVH